jgi:plastocyanin
MTMRRFLRTPSYITLAMLAFACGKEQPAGETGAATPSPSVPAATGAQTPDPGRKVITIEMTTDEKGVNKFTPAKFEAHRGDVLRFTLVAGVHNVHFLADSNPPGVALPPASALLQLPGQTVDVKVTWAPGKYYFQCDPHALLGMIGRVEVEDESEGSR